MGKLKDSQEKEPIRPESDPEVLGYNPQLTRERYLRAHWNPLLLELIERHATNKIVLDLGCGVGFYTDAIARNARHVIGMDLSFERLRSARKHYPQLDLVLADAYHIPLTNESVDVVVGIGLLEYLFNKPAGIEEVRRVLKKDGVCILKTPNRYSSQVMVDRILTKVRSRPYQRREVSVNSLLRLCEEHKFTPLECIMDDGLVWLPDLLDATVGMRTYLSIEQLFKRWGPNLLSTDMLIAAKKE